MKSTFIKIITNPYVIVLGVVLFSFVLYYILQSLFS